MRLAPLRGARKPEVQMSPLIDIIFLLLALAIGYPLGKVAVGPISLGPTAGTLVTGVIIAMIAQTAFDITYQVPGILSSMFLLLFMYALGLKVGPQFFAGLKSGGLAFVTIGFVVWALNWVICFFGAKLAGLDAGGFERCDLVAELGEADDGIKPVSELRCEEAVYYCLVFASFAGNETDGLGCHFTGTRIGGHNDYYIPEIRLFAVIVRQGGVIHDLQ